MKKDNCPYCKELKNGMCEITNKKRIITNTLNFVVVPTIGGFIENYLLIIPKAHINCFGELSAEEWIELKKIISWQKTVNNLYFKSGTIIFEHGSINPSDTNGKSIVHAHLHILPSNESLLSEIEKYTCKIVCIDDIKQLSSICYEYDEYIYYQDNDGKNYIIIHNGLPSQFLRKILADVTGNEKWNWREFPCIDNVERCLQLYSKSELQYENNQNGGVTL